MWRAGTEEDDAAVVGLYLDLYREDPGPFPADPPRALRTLDTFRRSPERGRCVVLDEGSGVEGYALLVPFWSNELGGETCIVDEIYVAPAARGLGMATRLLQAIGRDRDLWPSRPVALAVEVTPGNARARALYQRLGFTGGNASLVRPVV